MSDKARKTGGVPYYSVPGWVHEARARAKETLQGMALEQELARINQEWVAQR